MAEAPNSSRGSAGLSSARESARDLRALAAADLITDEHTGDPGAPLPAAGLRPPLHLNASECYRKLGDSDRAREYLRQAQDTIGALGDDEYGTLIKDGLKRLGEQLREP